MIHLPEFNNYRTMHIPTLRILFMAFGLGMIAACTPADQSNVPATGDDSTTQEDLDLTAADNMIRQMPSPIEMAILVKHSGGEYNASLLNPIQNIDRYATTGKKTLNMGVYSADVGYTSLYKQTQETVFYLNNIRKLSDAIGLSDAFDKSVFERVEANIEHRDSLLHILSGAYDISNDYLKNNDRMNTSLLMLGGGWIETMYLASNLGEAGGRPGPEIASRVAQQDVVLRKIIATMRMIPEDSLVAEFATKLDALSKVLVAKELVLGTEEAPKVDNAKMEKVYVLIDEIRAWVVA
ncbi:MAG: hypothetical protein K9J06_02395 [Flavobacteriales bacterium]|nr:hypothetical protein [Flavobacteriales bacterium]